MALLSMGTAGAADVTVQIATGRYDENVVIPHFLDDHTLTLAGAGADTTIIDGGDQGSVISIAGYDPSNGLSGDVSVSGLTITGGDGGDGGADSGGGMTVGSYVEVYIEDCKFTDKYAAFGGAILVEPNATLHETHSSLSRKYAVAGGGVYLSLDPPN